jgi:hypothetical protein
LTHIAATKASIEKATCTALSNEGWKPLAFRRGFSAAQVRIADSPDEEKAHSSVYGKRRRNRIRIFCGRDGSYARDVAVLEHT